MPPNRDLLTAYCSVLADSGHVDSNAWAAAVPRVERHRWSFEIVKPSVTHMVAHGQLGKNESDVVVASDIAPAHAPRHVVYAVHDTPPPWRRALKTCDHAGPSLWLPKSVRGGSSLILKAVLSLRLDWSGWMLPCSSLVTLSCFCTSPVPSFYCNQVWGVRCSSTEI